MISTIVLGGGCFWCTEAVYKEIEGVKKIVSGYSGGHTKNPSYRDVCSGTTGHAEAVEISYDPAILSLQTIIRIHLYTHDPTTLNRQGADEGTQYRSVIFYRNEEEKSIILTEMKKASVDYKQPLVTEVKPLEVFYPAESYHQSYYELNPGQNYCRFVIEPKIMKTRKLFKELLKKSDQP
jgi:methionine-S-sulfoxide reductase